MAMGFLAQTQLLPIPSWAASTFTGNQEGPGGPRNLQLSAQFPGAEVVVIAKGKKAAAINPKVLNTLATPSLGKAIKLQERLGGYRVTGALHDQPFGQQGRSPRAVTLLNFQVAMTSIAPMDGSPRPSLLSSSIRTRGYPGCPQQRAFLPQRTN